MKLGLEAGEFTLDLAVELGIHGVPVGIDQLAAQGVENALAAIRKRGLQVCQIGAFGYNPLSTSTDQQAAQSDLLKKVIPLAGQTGCAYIVIGPGNFHPSGFGADDPRNHTSSALNQMADSIGPMLDLAAQHQVNLSIELYLKGAINSPQKFLSLWDRLKKLNLRANIDPSSLYDYADLLDPRAKVEQVCAGLAGHYGLVHIKEIKLGEGFHIHAGLAPLGKGATDWAQMLSLAAPHLPADSWAILEHVQSPGEGRESFQFIRETARRAGIFLE